MTASCAGGQYETDCTHSSQSYCTWTQPSGGVLDPQSQADSQATSMPGFSEDISGSDVLKSVLVCLVYCATVAYVVLNMFLGLKFACILPAHWVFVIVTAPMAYRGHTVCTDGI